MFPVFTYDQICSKLSSDFDFWATREPGLKVRMCGLLFARPQIQLASQEIFPEIEYFDERTGRHVNIYVAGCYSRHLPDFSFPNGRRFHDERSVGRTNEWNYSDIAFNMLRTDFESRTSWQYEDGVELLLTNATLNHRSREASLDFSSAVRIDLQKARAIGKIQSVAEIIGKMARYCEAHRGDDPTWGFSDAMGANIARSSPWHLFMSVLPEGIRGDAETARLFVTENLKKK